MKSNEKSSKEKHLIWSRTCDVPDDMLEAVNRMHRGCLSTTPDGVAGSRLDVRPARANTETEERHIQLLEGQMSITLSAPLRLWQISRNLLGRVDCFFLKRGLVFAGEVSRLDEYCANGGEWRPSWAMRWLRWSPPCCQPRVLICLLHADWSALGCG